MTTGDKAELLPDDETLWRAFWRGYNPTASVFPDYSRAGQDFKAAAIAGVKAAFQAAGVSGVPEGVGVCAFDRDECTVTLAFDTEEQVNAFIANLPPKKRVRLMDDTAAPER